MTRMIERIIDKSSWIGHAGSAVLLFFMMFLIVAEVISRLCFKTSFGLSFSLNPQILVAVSFLGVSFIQAEDKHLKVTLLTSKLGKQAQIVFQIMVSIILLGLALIACWTTWEIAFMSLKYGLMSTGRPALPLAPHELIACTGNFLLFCVCVVASVKKIRSLRRPVGLSSDH